MASPMLTRVPKVARPMLAAIIRTIFVPRGKRDLVGAQFDEVVTMLARSHPTVADMLDDAREDLLAFAEFPPTHWRQIGIPITVLAATLGVPYQRLRRLEIGTRADPDLEAQATAALERISPPLTT